MYSHPLNGCIPSQYKMQNDIFQKLIFPGTLHFSWIRVQFLSAYVEFLIFLKVCVCVWYSFYPFWFFCDCGPLTGPYSTAFLLYFIIFLNFREYLARFVPGEGTQTTNRAKRIKGDIRFEARCNVIGRTSVDLRHFFFSCNGSPYGWTAMPPVVLRRVFVAIEPKTSVNKQHLASWKIFFPPPLFFFVMLCLFFLGTTMKNLVSLNWGRKGSFFLDA